MSVSRVLRTTSEVRLLANAGPDLLHRLYDAVGVVWFADADAHAVAQAGCIEIADEDAAPAEVVSHVAGGDTAHLAQDVIAGRGVRPQERQLLEALEHQVSLLDDTEEVLV